MIDGQRRNTHKHTAIQIKEMSTAKRVEKEPNPLNEAIFNTSFLCIIKMTHRKNVFKIDGTKKNRLFYPYRMHTVCEFECVYV